VRSLFRIAGIVAILVVAPLHVGAGDDRICTQNSQPAPPPTDVIRINSATCGTYGEFISRQADTGEDVLIRYMVHRPAEKEKPKALVVLIAGGLLGTGITGNAGTGQVLTAGANFLVRSAQLFAEHGFVALTIHRPVRLTGGGPVAEFPTEGADSVQWDHYRISAKHAFDIVRAIAVVNTENLPVFLAGTSRGALSVVANNMLGDGILLSSPVTSGPAAVAGCPPAPTCALYVNYPWPTLQPGFVAVPTYVLAHQLDGCGATTPANSLALHNAFLAAGIDSRFDQVSGGFAVPGEPLCEALHFHGFTGIETTAVKFHAKRLDKILEGLTEQFKNNKKPKAGPGAVGAATAYTIDLSTLAKDGGDTLTYSLPYPRSYRRDPALAPNLELVGSLVTYTPVGPGPMTDGFTYLVSDGKGGISASYVVVTVAP